MTPDALIAPVSPDAPCGPDLHATSDPEYDAYYFGALGRLPSYYVQPGVVRPDGTRSPDRIFEPGSIDHRAERTAVNGLLSRSRDLRLLVLRAQWDALAGKLPDLAETVEGIASLLETCADTVYPTLADGPGERRDTLGDLVQPVTMIQPLQFAPLVGSTEVTLRKLRVADGHAQPLAAENDLDANALRAALADPGYAKAVSATADALQRLAGAIDRIERAGQDSTPAYVPPLDLLRDTVGDMLRALSDANPDLVKATPPDTEAQAEAEPSAPPAPASMGPPSDVLSHAHARKLLEACEAYYRSAEPSSAALLLVTQARLLIGKPLIEALETLMPADAGKALVSFGGAPGFALGADKLKQLSAAAPPPPENTQPVPDVTAVSDGAEAARILSAVEAYFRATERSSPVPMLLKKARAFLDQDFQTLVSELLPCPVTS